MRNTTLGALLFVAISACTAPGIRGGPPGRESSVLARVDGEPVSMASFKTWLADTSGVQAREEFLRQWLLEREGRRRGIVVSDQEIEQAMQALWKDWVDHRLGGDVAALDAELARQGHDRKTFQRWFHWQKRRELLAARLIHLDRTIDDEKLRSRFEQQYGPAGTRTEV
ncbi:MAG TPA: hypothetical protein VM509_07315, partial [Planctomycetota bacterium]|nr:hypothetical protein [Planctomycetota bacterium]